MRDSPSGSGLVTDLRTVGFEISDVAAPGDYFVIPFASIAAILIPVADPQASLAGAANGVHTRRGRIGRARVLFGAAVGDGPTAARAPTLLQWTVTDEAGVSADVGEVVSVPWSPIVPVFPPPSLGGLQNEEVFFGSVVYPKAGFYALKVTIGAPVVGAPGIGTLILTYEEILSPAAPLAGPL